MRIQILQLRRSVLARNTVWVLASQGIVFISQAAYFLVLARLLGSTEYGVFAGAAALVAILSNFSSVGSDMVLLRYVSADRSCFNEYWGNAIFCISITGSMITGLVVLLGPQLLRTNAVGMLAMIAFSEACCAKLADCAGKVFQAFEQLPGTAILSVLTSALRLSVALTLWWTLHSVSAQQWAAAALTVSMLSATVSVTVTCAKFGLPRLNLLLPIHRLREGFAYSVAFSTTSIYNDIDKAMLTHYGMNSANGTYSVAYKIIDVACIPIRSLHAAAMPRFFRLGKVGVHKSAPFAKDLLKRTSPYGLISAIVLYLVAPAIPTLIGQAFTESISALRWLCLIPAMRALHVSAGDAITSAGYQHLRTYSQAGAAALNFALNLAFIPAFSWQGAAWSSLMTDGALALANWLILFALLRHSQGKEVSDERQGAPSVTNF
jgi:O-antigen/teichoic acid export membrane protein